MTITRKKTSLKVGGGTAKIYGQNLPQHHNVTDTFFPTLALMSNHQEIRRQNLKCQRHNRSLNLSKLLSWHKFINSIVYLIIVNNLAKQYKFWNVESSSYNENSRNIIISHLGTETTGNYMLLLITIRLPAVSTRFAIPIRTCIISTLNISFSF